MAITADGTLFSTFLDTCTNYKPDKSKPKNVSSLKLGMIYECKNYVHGYNPDQGCFFCVFKDYEN